MDKLDSPRGFTLVEVSILLTVVVILSAMITPVLSGAISDARLQTARAEMAAIGRALQAFLDDIGCVFVPQHNGSHHRSGSRSSGRLPSRGSNVVEAPTFASPHAPPAAAGGDARLLTAVLARSGCSAPELCSGDAVELLVTSGDIPALGPEGDDFWVEPPDGEWVDFLEYYLVSNTPGGEGSRAFPNQADCGPLDGHAGGNRAWRGAYMTLGGSDPWGNRYAINTYLLTQTWGEDVVILSAGPDQEIDSEFFIDGFVPGDDDLAIVLSTGPESVPGR